MQQKLEAIAELSNFFGKDSMYVFLGGGNTSVKDSENLYIKPSGVALATIKAEDFLKLERQAVEKMFTIPMPEATSEDLNDPVRKNLFIQTREACAKMYLEAAVRPLGAGRPSVETPVHEVFDWTFIVHLHPAYVNGMTCALKGKEAAELLFPDALWLDYCDPGFTLATTVKKELDDYKAKNGAQPHVFFLQNHGVFVGADTCEEIRDIYTSMTELLEQKYKEAMLLEGDFKIASMDKDSMMSTAPALRTLLAPSEDARAIVETQGKCKAFAGPLTPDHIVYAKSFPYVGDASAATIKLFEETNGYLPKVVEIPGCGVFTAGDTLKDARAAAIALRNAILVEHLSCAFGGPKYLSQEQYKFIENWEVESYRKKVSAGTSGGRLKNRVCVVTGGAQGFGYGIADYLAANGGIVVIADMNLDGALAASKTLNEKYSGLVSFAVDVNVADEASVEKMMQEIVGICGGVDLLVANAGVLRAGSVLELSKKDWDFVTDINYTGYFLCCKHAAKVMATQIVDGMGMWSDIVQVNSKSGLEGSNKNGAYAGSKFGTIGLTQSFAKELVTSCIKVNSVCPGNYYDGPLWSHPERGLFIQYLQTGKVPGAKTVDDVRKFYEAKVPMGRGCLPEDVAKAIIYCVEQNYETGQAIPVTGGQVMLH